ncbi:glycosyltransferase family 4 protein [Clostridium perfringens]|uniref:glycosyltransferase family 4 protein n=1 Tax=Clostridium perfringens TaxID=1502 RepID=UPI0010946DAF|nr:glycosyltransferase family 4 protein [Clostridium perfringens]TGY46118.1 glycosyltransferase family 4 protein [Clostridium perfringens]
MAKICFVSGVISRSGGTERVGTIIANELSKRGFEVTILSFWNQGEPYYKLEKDVKVDYLLEAKEGKLYRTYIYPIIKLRNYILNNQIDILIDIDTLLTTYSGYACWGTKCKLVSWEHFNYWNMLTDKKRINAKKNVKRFADKLIVLTDDDLKEHINKMGFEKNKIQRIYNPSPFNSSSVYNKDSNIFLAVGRLTNVKGFDLLLYSWKLFENSNKNWNLKIVGSGEEEKSLKSIIKKLNLVNVELINHTKEIEKYYKNAACYILSSRYEGFPMVILEAESFGLPIISFDCKTGPAEMIIDGENGYLIEQGNVEKLSKAMLKFTNSNEQRINMSNKSKEIVYNFSIEKIVDEWEDMLYDLL